MTGWLDGFEVVTFPQSLGGTFTEPVRRLIFHETQGWCAQHAFNVYAAAPKGACPHITGEYAGTDGSGTDRYVKKLAFQHVPLSLAAYALQRGDANHVCKVQTNRAGVVQFERVGFVDDVVSDDETRWWGEMIVAPVLRECRDIPYSVLQSWDRMSEDEWAAWPGGLARHINVPCQPDGHTDGRSLDLDRVLEYALRAHDPPEPPPETDMILLRVTDDPGFPGGVILELSGNGISWVQSGNIPPIYAAGGVRTVDCTKAIVDDILLTKPGVGRPPSQVGSIVHW